MKYISRLFAIVSMFTISAYTPVNSIQKEGSDEWKSFAENNYSIQYPTTWELNNSKQMGTSFILFSPLTSEKDRFRENVNLLIQDLKGQNLDLDKYTEISEEQVKTMLTDGKIIESKRMTSGTSTYQKIIYTGTQGVYKLEFEQYYWVEKDKAYILTLTCEENQFAAFKLTGEKILNSFKLK